MPGLCTCHSNTSKASMDKRYKSIDLLKIEAMFCDVLLLSFSGREFIVVTLLTAYEMLSGSMCLKNAGS